MVKVFVISFCPITVRLDAVDMTIRSAAKLCLFTQKHLGAAKVPTRAFYFPSLELASAGQTQRRLIARRSCGGIAAACLAPTHRGS